MSSPRAKMLDRREAALATLVAYGVAWPEANPSFSTETLEQIAMIVIDPTQPDAVEKLRALADAEHLFDDKENVWQPTDFRIPTVVPRLEADGDAWAGWLSRKQDVMHRLAASAGA